jgi:copper transport protein
VRRLLLVLVLVPGLLLAGQGPALAHADLEGATPANGSVLPSWPKRVELQFSEPVEVETVRLLNGAGAAVPVIVERTGSKVSVEPQRKRKGAFTVTWSVASGDGHVVSGASSFAVGRMPRSTGPAVRLATAPAVPASIDGTKAGLHTITFASKAVSGEVLWTHPGLLGPISTPVSGVAGRAGSSVLLALAGVWQIEATLVMPDYSVIVVRSSVEVGK